MGNSFKYFCLTAVLLSSCVDPGAETKKKAATPVPPPAATAEATKKPIKLVDPGALTRMPIGTLYQLTQRNAAFIIDVRPVFVYKRGHIAGAYNLPEKKFEKLFPNIEPRIKAANKSNTPVVIYCTDLACPDAVTVGVKISNRGYDVSVLQGGYKAWKLVTE